MRWKTLRIPSRPRKSDDPWEAPDPAPALALSQKDWYARHRDRARAVYRINELLILLTTASTTVTAALRATAWVTALLASGTLVLAGLHKVLDSRESWLEFGSSWARLQVAVNDYRLLAAERRDEHAQRQLVHTVNDVISAHSQEWAARRRSLADGSP
ncbi:MAG TPA: DUF4231 domain-containing protein [Streptosporangiaceae bacterium]|nr:DUF4231 domain-containing protein [Streptosporangiaceae bacterium]